MAILANLRHEIFAQNLCKGQSVIESYVNAGYNEDYGNAYNLKKAPHIQKRVQEIMSGAANKVEISASKILAEMAKLAFHNPADYLTINEDGTATVDLTTLDRDQSAAITEITSESDDKGTRTKVKLADKKAALETLGKHLGLWIDRTEHGQAGDFTNIHSMDDLENSLIEQLGAEDAKEFMKLVRPEKLN